MALNFNNGKFRILQVSDPQDMHYPRRSMLKMLDKAYDTLNPDLVVFTGDNVLSNHLLDARFGNKKVAEGKLKYLNVEGVKAQVWKQLIYHKNKWLSKSLRVFIEYIKENGLYGQ